MDASSGTTETDIGSSPWSSNKMTYSGGFTLSAGGALTGSGSTDPSVAFNGTTGKGVRTHDSISAPGACPDYTNNAGWVVETWVYLTSAVTVNQFVPSAAANNPVVAGAQFWSFTVNGGNPINFQLYDSSGIAVQTNAHTTNNSLNTWIMAATIVVGAGSNHTSATQIYRNGVLDYSAGAYSSTALVNCTNQTDISIAAWTDGSSSAFIPGRIDEFATYNTNIGASRILAHYNAAVTAPSGSRWPFTVKRPELPKFRNGDYLTQFVARGYHTGRFAPSEMIPQYLIIGYAPFSKVPSGNVGQR